MIKRIIELNCSEHGCEPTSTSYPAVLYLGDIGSQLKIKFKMNGKPYEIQDTDKWKVILVKNPQEKNFQELVYIEQDNQDSVHVDATIPNKNILYITLDSEIMECYGKDMIMYICCYDDMDNITTFKPFPISIIRNTEEIEPPKMPPCPPPFLPHHHHHCY